MCWLYEDLLLRSPFCFFPYVRDGERIPGVFDARDNDPRLTHQVQLTQAMAVTIYSDMVEINQLQMILAGSYARSDALHNHLIRSNEARIAAVREKDDAVAELARLKAATANSAPAPVPPSPAIAPGNPASARPLRLEGPRTRMTARKSVRRSCSRSPSLGSDRTRSPSFSRSRSRSRSPVE